MTNDIRKNIMFIESILLDESFKDAQQKFSTTANPDEVKSYIEKFKELSKRNIIKGQDKDIGFWIKGDWDSFKKFVDSNSAVVTNRQTKATQKKDSIVVYKDEEKQVVIPLTIKASIQYGKNTRWCTAATESKNYFIDYFYMRKITLFYVLFKDGNKYACAFHPKRADTIECFNQADRSMSFKKFEVATGISKKDIQNWYNLNKTKVEDSSDLNKCSEEVQLATVKEYGNVIYFIANPTEKVQLAAVTQEGGAIAQIIDKGIIPSEEVQLAAVTQYGNMFKYMVEKGIIPSEAVKLATVKENGYAIKHIDNPSEEVQLAAVKKHGGYIEYIDNPTEKVQLAAVAQNGYAISDIRNPSEEVQIAAVTQYGDVIEHIANPSEEVQLAAVTNTRFAIKHIDNPTEKVKALHTKLWGNVG